MPSLHPYEFANLTASSTANLTTTFPTATPASATSTATTPATVTSSHRILEFRDQYRACHIQIPGEEQRMAAIQVDGGLYSLLKVTQEQNQALTICDRLTQKGTQSIITRIPKGYAIWTLEIDAYCAPPIQSLSAEAQASLPDSEVNIIQSRADYKICHIRVPDLKMKLIAILIDQNYYGLFKIVDTQPKAIELAHRLLRGGDQVRVTAVEHGYAVWVLEPDAYLFVNE